MRDIESNIPPSPPPGAFINNENATRAQQSSRSPLHRWKVHFGLAQHATGCRVLSCSRKKRGRSIEVS